MTEKSAQEPEFDLEKHRGRPFGIPHQEAIQVFKGLNAVTFGKEVTIIAGGGSKESVNKPLDLERIKAAMDPHAATGFASKNGA
jgi:hypothetical protein